MINETILVINAGSSSLKFKLFNKNNLQDVFYGQIDGFGTGEPIFVIKNSSSKEQVFSKKFIEANNTRDNIILEVINTITSYSSNYKIVAIGHRIVHGGEKYNKPLLLNSSSVEYLKSINHLAPLHMPHNLKPVEIILANLPNIVQIACFDTSFHTSASTISKLYAIDYKFFKEDGIMRYGAHGTSYEYIAEQLKIIDNNLYQKKVVVCHLGSGASLCAIENGKSVTTTMGFSVLEGLVMGTRPGNIDPGILLYLLNQKGVSPKELEHMLYHKSGILGLSGFTNDFRLLQQKLTTDSLCKQAWDVFIFNIVKNIGALIAVMQGVDGIIFTAGVGENSVIGRKEMLNKLQFLGVELDENANAKNSIVISAESSKIKALVIPTNEELMIAKHVIKIIDTVN